jgi:hypothetical protein
MTNVQSPLNDGPIKETPQMKMWLLVRAGTVALLAVAAGALFPSTSWAQSGAPKYEPDLLWPLPNE